MAPQAEAAGPYEVSFRDSLDGWEITMRRLLVLLAAAALACVPAVLGLAGNQFFSEEVAVRVPPQVVAAATPVERAERPTATPITEPGEHSTSPATPSSDRGKARPSDDTRRTGPRDDRREPTTRPSVAVEDQVTGTASGTTGQNPVSGGTRRGQVEPGDDRGAVHGPGDDANRARRGSGSGAGAPQPTGAGSSGAGSSGSGSSGSGGSGSPGSGSDAPSGHR
jgi:hypothetical protein